MGFEAGVEVGADAFMDVKLVVPHRLDPFEELGVCGCCHLVTEEGCRECMECSVRTLLKASTPA
jgi:hypothetical protein